MQLTYFAVQVRKISIVCGSLSSNCVSKLLAELVEAYKTPYLGDASRCFCQELLTADENARLRDSPLYAKVMPVVQSSGTGKSRMLTEVCPSQYSAMLLLRADCGHVRLEEHCLLFLSAFATQIVQVTHPAMLESKNISMTYQGKAIQALSATLL